MPWTTETLLKAIADRAPTECINETRMAEIAGLTRRQIQHAALNLRRHGFIERDKHGCHTITGAGRKALDEGANLRSGPKGPQQSGQRHRDPGLRQRAWNVLRMGKKVTIDDILMSAVEGGERDAYSNIRKYVRALSRAGYIRSMATREQPLGASTLGCVRWLLIHDTGPDNPVWRSTRDVVYDPNLDREIPFDNPESWA